MALSHVLTVLDVTDVSLPLFRRDCIEDIESLLGDEVQIRNRNVLKHLPSRDFERLLLFFDWNQRYFEKFGSDPDAESQFTRDIFDQLRRAKRHHSKRQLLPQEPTFDEYLQITELLRCSPWEGNRQPEVRDSKEFTKWFIGEMQETMKMRGKTFNEDEFQEPYSRFCRAALDRLVLGGTSSGKDSPFLIGGRTQAGKSAFKMLVIKMSQRLGIPVVVLTKGIKECKELRWKLADVAADYHAKEAAEKIKKRHRTTFDDLFNDLKNFGFIVIADTSAQIKNAEKAIRYYQKDKRGFILIEDECDVMYRTEDGRQAMEQALKKFKDEENPMLNILISATLLPILSYMLHTDRNPGFLDFIQPSADYCWLENMKPLKDTEEIFLDEGTLKGSNDYGIPYFNEKVETLYMDALKPKALLLDCSTPYVSAINNITDKADGVQKRYSAHHTKPIVVTISGKGIEYRSTPDGDFIVAEKHETIGDILNRLDGEFGLERPIFVFGFTLMKRGMSFRSDHRVPTHILVHLGKAHSVDNMVQTLGRATGNGKRLLHQNGFSYVTTLLPANDWITANKYQNLQQVLKERMDEGKSLLQACRDDILPHHCDFLKGQNRPVGRMKCQRAVFETDMQFEEEPEDGDDEVSQRLSQAMRHVRRKVDDVEHQHVLEVLRDILKPSSFVSETRLDADLAEIHQHLNDKFDIKVSKKETKERLERLVRAGFIKMKVKKVLGKAAAHWELLSPNSAKRKEAHPVAKRNPIEEVLNKKRIAGPGRMSNKHRPKHRGDKMPRASRPDKDVQNGVHRAVGPKGMQPSNENVSSCISPSPSSPSSQSTSSAVRYLTKYQIWKPGPNPSGPPSGSVVRDVEDLF